MVDQLRGHAATELAPPTAIAANGHGAAGLVDLRHVRGQAAVKRALEVAAAGGHNLLTVGPPRGPARRCPPGPCSSGTGRW